MKRIEFLEKVVAVPIAAAVGVVIVPKKPKWEWKEYGFVWVREIANYENVNYATFGLGKSNEREVYSVNGGPWMEVPKPTKLICRADQKDEALRILNSV